MILHVFKRDVRRLWPAAAASLGVLAALARQDRWRSDVMSGPAEGYLNILMPVVWACLIGLAIQQEPLAGDRVFWITRPYRRPHLLAAKALFVAVFVHAPSLLADCYILAARGFSPLAWLPQLIAKQLLLACALTIPAMALASLAPAFSHFVLEIVAVAMVFVVLQSLGPPGPRWEPLDTVKRELVMLVVTVAAITIVAVQYFGRRLLLSRAVGVAGGAAAALVFAYLLPHSALAVRTAVSPSRSEPALRLDPAPRPGRRVPPTQAISVALPIVLAGFPEGTLIRTDSVRSDITGADGTHYHDTMRFYFRATDRPPYTAWIVSSSWNVLSPDWILLSFERPVYTKLAEGPVTISGEASVMSYRLGAGVWMPVGTTADLAVGRCSSEFVEGRWSEERLKVECESPAAGIQNARVRLWSPETGEEWQSIFGQYRSVEAGPAATWLSPLNRAQTFYNLSSDAKGPLWQIPRDRVAGARIEIRREIVEGYASVKYEFRDIDLRKYLVKPPGAASAK